MKIGSRKKSFRRRCAFKSCDIVFDADTPLQRYCKDDECIANRRAKYYETRKSKIRGLRAQKPIFNIVLRKPQLKGRTIDIHCAAKGVNGRCPNHFVIHYSSGQRVYPRFCSSHRNSYRRHRYENVKRTKDAEGTTTFPSTRGR